jgi:hypothetical protein
VKKLIFSLIAVLPLAAMAEPVKPTVMTLDLTGAGLFNHCYAEPVTVTSGSGQLIVRQDFGGDANGVHLLHRLNGRGEASGLLTGNRYLFSFNVPPAFYPNTSTNNQNGDHGMVNFIANVEMINMDDPGSGVSRLNVVIVTVLDFTNGVVADTKVLSVSRECTGRP